MSDFNPFAALIKAQFAKMSKGELFVAGNDSTWDAYLASFPDGTNPIFRVRAEYDCSCCRNYIRNIGNLVSIVNGELVSVWDVEGAEYPFNEVAAAMSKHVKAQAISGLFRTSEQKYGAQFTKELRDGKVHTWTHFHGPIDAKHRSEKVGEARGEYNSSASVFKRGLNELSPAAISTVIDLIADKALYRGEEFLPGLKAFQTLQKEYLKLKTDEQKNIFIWENTSKFGSIFRNTMLGGLIVALSGTPSSFDHKGDFTAAKDPQDLESAVEAYEKQAAPENYKRSKALITPRMVEDAMNTIRAEDLEDALQRRHATLADISINNVLWADSSAKSKMKDGIEGLLMSAAVKPAKVDDEKLEQITMEEFMATVLPKATSLEVFVRNNQQKNFMSVTAPVYADVKHLFKWDNDFAWSYDGNIADSALRQKVQHAGGRVDGVLRFSHTWNYDKRNASLMDLHVFMPGSGSHADGCHDRYPSGQRVGWNNRQDYTSNGKQDVDYTDAAPKGYVPVENITFPSMDKLKNGKYTFKIHNWALRQPTEAGARAEIEFGGNIYQYEIVEPMKNKEWITLAEATLKDGEFTIDHKYKLGNAVSQQKWGVQTETFVKVNTLMMSPNFWDEKTVGNKHWFFILEGCKNDEPTRGIYNEFLNARLDKHRKVFEVLGDKTKVQPVNDQLSGVGFSSTRNDSVVVKVAGNKLRKTYNITF